MSLRRILETLRKTYRERQTSTPNKGLRTSNLVHTTKPSHRAIAVFFILTFLQTLIPYNQLWANNNGPNAPEAAAFEPVDATDMVNLLTGDFSYVLPLLNVPSPEGGYPLALSYHGGIAHNQEASWVGLGWNLNPGSINRNINGFPDDWGKTNYEEFFYDAGWTEDEYNFSVGVDVHGFNIGLGASWGSHRSTGGFVSLGYGYKGIGINTKIGSGGSSIGVGYKGFTANAGNNGASFGYSGYGFNGSMDSNGVGVGYGLNTGGGSSLGVGLNYNYSSGLSGNISASLSGLRTNASIGISFSSQGASVYGGVNGPGISTANYGVSNGDATYNIDAFQAAIPIYMFYIGFGHRRVEYSLFKKNNLTVSGSVYPYHALETESASSYQIKENNFMDVHEFLPFSNQSMSLDYLVDQNYGMDKNNMALLAYDKYTVTSQGLSGSIAPVSYEELNLIDRGNTDGAADEQLKGYIGENFSSADGIYDLGYRTNFYFQNELSSFLRTDRTNIQKNPNYTTSGGFQLLNGFTTSNSGAFNENMTNGNRKRTGNFIETFTNNQIRDNQNTTGFIEAKHINRSQETDIFLDEGIGAFRITALDGKTYHYSLPVYNYELFYKNFKDETDENKNFFEIKKTKPYATHWLLTAITGPDYVDVNSNGAVDESDYGYWVEFDYGKWTDGYIWKGPVDGYDEHTNAKDSSDKTYSYYWGRKQIYYLDAVKTRTHTALFVKNLRYDNKSTELDIYEKKYTGGTFNVGEYSETVKSNEDIFRRPIMGYPNDIVYKEDGSTYKLPEYGTANSSYIETFRGNKISAKYIDAPENQVLKLDKILLLKNQPFDISKDRSSIVTTKTGYSIYNTGYSNLNSCSYDPVKNESKSCYTNDLFPYPSGVYMNDPTNITSFKVHQDYNILDERDIEGLNLEENASQVIAFNYDYSLATQSPNSDAPKVPGFDSDWDTSKGRLTLKSVYFKGKSEVAVVPPYRFEYANSSLQYNKGNQDEWGYHKTYPEAWSLNKITTPTGGQIIVNHDTDSYYSEAAYTETKSYDNIAITKNSSSNTFTISFLNTSDDLNNYFNTNTITNFTISRRDSFDALNTFTNTYKVKATSINNSSKSIVFEIDETLSSPYSLFRYEAMTNVSGVSCTLPSANTSDPVHCYSAPTIKSTKGPVLDFTTSNTNGREGGGIRVASIEVSGNDTSVKTVYDYTNLDNNKISGITSYAPSEEQKGIPYVSELPAPLVTYGSVTMKNYDNNDKLLGSTAYEFDVLKPYEESPNYLFCLGDFFKVEQQQNATFINGEVQANKYIIYNKLENIGRVKSVVSYNNVGQLLNKTISNYKQDLDSDGQIGVSQQSHKTLKKIQRNDVASYMISSSSKVEYPSVLESSTAIQGGFTNTTYYENRDMLTGQITQTRSVSSDGNEFKTKIIPAYYITPYGSSAYDYTMGAKVDNSTAKNMLTQTAETLTQIKDGSNWKTVGVSINTWNNDWNYQTYDGSQETSASHQSKIWRKHKIFAWKGEIDSKGAYVGFSGDDDNFNWTDPENQTNSKWIKTSTISLYDHYSMPLETTDINGNKASTKMGDDNTKIFAVANAAYNQMFYSGAEDLITGTDYFSGEVYKGENANISEVYHTGTKGVQVPINTKAFVVKPDSGKYKVSVWAYKGLGYDYTGTRLNVNGEIIEYAIYETISAGDWVQLNFYIKDSEVTTGQEVYVYNNQGVAIYDDFRMCPIASTMASYVYNEWDELTYIIGANNLATKYEYDDAGRLKTTYTEVIDNASITGGFKKASENFYNYQYQ
ncbi:hypothetical protein [Aquimarina pacifica]|uniref:hypothetical protein n=1 Tax=Aquimarina pacifica TaxID=1296415 RepID=UPI000472AF4C|nr:hypothetical protein [Aquimarina pacifica]